MDNVSHSLTGLVLAQAGLKRVSPRATAILLVSANIPDCDIAALTGGSLRYLEAHRGYTHCFLLLPVMALLSVLLIAVLYRQRLPWLKAWAAACVGVISHLFLDWTNSYGIRLLLPFSSRWFHGDLNGLYDGVFLLVLATAVLWPLLANLVGGEIGDRSSSGRAVALAALFLIAILEFGRGILHTRAVANLQARMYEEQQPLQAAALPDSFNPFRWSGVVETESAYITVPVNASGRPELRDIQSFYKPSQTATIQDLKREESFRFFSYFARFPVWSFVPVTMDGARATRADLTDLRFGTPGSGSFHCLAVVDPFGRVRESGFTFGSP